MHSNLQSYKANCSWIECLLTLTDKAAYQLRYSERDTGAVTCPGRMVRVAIGYSMLSMTSKLNAGFGR